MDKITDLPLELLHIIAIFTTINDKIDPSQYDDVEKHSCFQLARIFPPAQHSNLRSLLEDECEMDDQRELQKSVQL